MGGWVWVVEVVEEGVGVEGGSGLGGVEFAEDHVEEVAGFEAELLEELGHVAGGVGVEHEPEHVLCGVAEVEVDVSGGAVEPALGGGGGGRDAVLGEEVEPAGEGDGLEAGVGHGGADRAVECVGADLAGEVDVEVGGLAVDEGGVFEAGAEAAGGAGGGAVGSAEGAVEREVDQGELGEGFGDVDLVALGVGQCGGVLGEGFVEGRFVVAVVADEAGEVLVGDFVGDGELEGVVEESGVEG